jgi:hypothetical protein
MRDVAFIAGKLLENYTDMEVSRKYPFLLLTKVWWKKVKRWGVKGSGLFEYAIQERRHNSILLGWGEITFFNE